MTTLSEISGEKVKCLLCPHYCTISAGKSGICGVRKNTGHEVVLQTYGIISGYALDPVEKKPLYHFFPGYNILSAGSYGCNMRCDFCQNFRISQYVPEALNQDTTPEKLVSSALSSPHNIGIAFTYNEPVIWFEFMRDTAIAAREKGLRTVMVSNGFVNPEPMKEITGFTDAFNIDLKAFNNDFYRKLTGADIEPVKKSLRIIAMAGRHLEITTLIIPGLNDSEKEMRAQTEWISTELGEHIPLHLSRYFPMNRRNDPQTPEKTLERLASIASEKLSYVYIGNTVSAAYRDTECPSCGIKVTIRSGYNIQLQNLDENGNCKNCGNSIYRFFSPYSK